MPENFETKFIQPNKQQEKNKKNSKNLIYLKT